MRLGPSSNHMAIAPLTCPDVFVPSAYYAAVGIVMPQLPVQPANSTAAPHESSTGKPLWNSRWRPFGLGVNDQNKRLTRIADLPDLRLEAVFVSVCHHRRHKPNELTLTDQVINFRSCWLWRQQSLRSGERRIVLRQAKEFLDPHLRPASRREG